MKRKKILRELNKSFSTKYNFKRLLQTTSNLSKLYSKHEDAVNSVHPIRQIPIFERDLTAIYHPKAETPDVIDMEIFGPGGGDWPSRVKYAEQILDLATNNETAWVVRICRENLIGDMNQVEVLEYRKPRISPHYSIYGNQHNNYEPIFNKKTLSKIDQDDSSSYYLISQNESPPMPSNLLQCGLIPNGIEIYNTTFHHKDIALLYADSLREIVKYFSGYSI